MPAPPSVGTACLPVGRGPIGRGEGEGEMKRVMEGKSMIARLDRCLLMGDPIGHRQPRGIREMSRFKTPNCHKYLEFERVMSQWELSRIKI